MPVKKSAAEMFNWRSVTKDGLCLITKLWRVASKTPIADGLRSAMQTPEGVADVESERI
jgi:hypothetical protein